MDMGTRDCPNQSSKHGGNDNNGSNVNEVNGSVCCDVDAQDVYKISPILDRTQFLLGRAILLRARRMVPLA
jgi:hypothetical protein